MSYRRATAERSTMSAFIPMALLPDHGENSFLSCLHNLHFAAKVASDMGSLCTCYSVVHKRYQCICRYFLHLHKLWSLLSSFLQWFGCDWAGMGPPLWKVHLDAGRPPEERACHRLLAKWVCMSVVCLTSRNRIEVGGGRGTGERGGLENQLQGAEPEWAQGFRTRMGTSGQTLEAWE